MALEFVDYNGNDITSLITQPNDNLLTNSDFRYSIINQKGQSIYNGQATWLYGIDMWRAVDVTIDTQFKGQLTISGDGYLVQLIDLSIDTYTLTFKIKNINKGNINVYLEQTEPVHEETISSVGLHSFVYKTTKNAKGVGIRLNNFSGDIEFIKLEKGNQFTGMPAWNEAEELNKCKYYFERINVASWGYFTSAYVITRTNTAEFPYKFSKKNRIPSIKLSGQLKILFYEEWADCTVSDGAVSVTKDQFRYAFTYPQYYDRANGTSCPISLVDTGSGCYIDIDAYIY